MKRTIMFTCILFVFAAIGISQEKDRSALKTSSTSTTWKYFDVNTIQSVIADDGPFNDYRMSQSSGLSWPKGTSKTAVYTSGLWIVGKHTPTGILRTAVQYYLTEFQRGPIVGIFNTTTNDSSVAANPSDTAYRIYKIQKGDNALSNPDYADWPGNLGAPYNDVNTNGSWDKGTDTPKLHGHQTLWHVYNDLNAPAHKSIGTTKPMGIEVQALYYGFDKPGPLANTMFMKWKIINKSDAQYDSVFFGCYSDTDMGDANDDAVGYDSTSKISYVYNGDNADNGSSGYGSSPPALGFMFIGGTPAVELYAHPLIMKSSATHGEPPLGNISFPERAFNLMRALTVSGDPTLNPLTNVPSRFTLSGDPVTNTGWLWSSHGFVPLDVRQFLSIGPVTLAPGASQEVHAAFVIAQSTDRLQSVALLRQYADSIRKIVAADPDFATSVGNDNEPILPVEFSLEQNYPNPFNPTTTIRYSLPKQTKVILSIHNILGQQVATLTDDVKEAGNHTVLWNGKNDVGNPVASGIYFYHITADGFASTKKMLLLK